MTTRTRGLLAVFAVAVAYAFRASLVGLLTRTTGTWVGAPDD